MGGWLNGWMGEGLMGHQGRKRQSRAPHTQQKPRRGAAAAAAADNAHMSPPPAKTQENNNGGRGRRRRAFLLLPGLPVSSSSSSSSSSFLIGRDTTVDLWTVVSSSRSQKNRENREGVSKGLDISIQHPHLPPPLPRLTHTYVPGSLGGPPSFPPPPSPPSPPPPPSPDS